MKLVTVRARFDYLIVVEDDAEFKDKYAIALGNLRDAAGDLSVSDFDVQLYSYDKIKPTGWDDMCIPYGGDGNTRTGDYLKGSDHGNK